MLLLYLENIFSEKDFFQSLMISFSYHLYSEKYSQGNMEELAYNGEDLTQTILIFHQNILHIFLVLSTNKIAR